MNTLHDVRLAMRSLVKNRGFAATAVLTLALGIGASVAIFSVVNAVLIEPLPYKDPSRLVVVWQELRARGVNEFPFPGGDIPDVRAKGTFEDLAIIQTGRQSLTLESDQPEQIRTAFVSWNTLGMLGIRVARGRDFQAEDSTPLAQPAGPGPQAGQAAGGGPQAGGRAAGGGLPAAGTPSGRAAGAAPPGPQPAASSPQPAGPQPVAPPAPPPEFTVILSHEFWVRHYGSDPAALGKRITQQNGAIYNVVGITEPDAQLLFAPRNNIERTPDVWIASRINYATATRTAGQVRVIAKLKPGLTVAQAQQQMDSLATDLRNTHVVKRNAGVHINVVPMHELLVSDVRISILALMGAVTFVLLIACANLANLTLTQSARRERDLAVRAALGAGRATLVRQMLVESGVLALVGAIVGLGLARLGIVVLQEMGPATLPRLQNVAIDWRVLGFTFVAALVSAILFGVLPAFRASRPDVVEVLRQSGRTSSLGSGRVRNGLVVVEVALTFVLLIGSGLMLRSLVILQHVDPGYDPNGVLTFFMPNMNRPSADARREFIRRVQAEVGALPGVRAVSGALPLPLDGLTSNVPYGTEAAAADPTKFQQADSRNVQVGYFEAMRTRIIEGRVFNETDNAIGGHSIVVDRLLAQRAFEGQSAVGKRLLLRIGGQNPEPYEIIGVVDHQRHTTMAEDGRETIFYIDGQRGFGSANRFIVRTDGDPAALAESVKATITRLDRTIGLTDVQPMSFYVDRAQAPTRFALALTSVFAVIAAVLAVVGLYGVLSTVVRQRTAEIGVRLAFGAERQAIFNLIVGRGLLLAVIGIAIGAAVALGSTRLIQTMLVGVRATDPMTFIAIAGLFLVVAAAACGIPAYRASRLDPTVALRGE